ncbi:MAG: hypothetical protein JSW66_14260, partial [Phycisphaerales bacterium]
MSDTDRGLDRIKCVSIAAGVVICLRCCGPACADLLAELARPHEGRSMRATSTAKIDAHGKPDPNGVPDPNSNRDNSSVQPGRRKILMDVEGP